MAFYTSAGTVMSVSTDLPATYDDTGFAALTWTEVGEITGVPEHGDTYNPVNHNPLADRQTRVVKGSKAVNNLSIPLALDRGDAGQIIVLDHTRGAKVDDPAAFKVEYPDGSTEYFNSLVMAFTVMADNVDSVLSGNISLASGFDIVTVTA